MMIYDSQAVTGLGLIIQLVYDGINHHFMCELSGKYHSVQGPIFFFFDVPIPMQLAKLSGVCAT